MDNPQHKGLKRTKVKSHTTDIAHTSSHGILNEYIQSGHTVSAVAYHVQ